MDRTAVRARLRDILVEQGTENYDTTFLDNWIDVAYGYLCTMAAELDRSYFLVSTPGVSYPADTNSINIAGIVGDETGTPTPVTPFRLVGIDDETDSSDPGTNPRIRAAPWEHRHNVADDAWLFVGPMRIGLRSRPETAR